MAKSLSPSMKKLKEKAEENTSISVGTSSNRKTLKSGAFVDHANKTSPSKPKSGVSQGIPVIGMSKGVTKNMDNFESLRVDCWLTDTVNEGEDIYEAYARIESIIDEVLEESVLATAGEC